MLSGYSPLSKAWCNRAKLFLPSKIPIVATWIAVTAICLGSDENRSDSQATDVSRILELGGKVTRDNAREGKPVVEIDLHGSDIDNDALKDVIVFKDLQCLNLQGTAISDTGLGSLVKLTKLTRLGLGNCNITDKGLKSLKQLESLEDLELGNTKINGKGLKELKGLKKLTSMSLVGIKPKRGSFEGISKLSNLEFLDLHSAQISDRDLVSLKDLSRLQKLFLTNTKVSAEAVRKLRNQLPKTKIVADIKQNSP